MESYQIFSVSLPQTGERGTAVLILNKDKGGQIEIMDFTRHVAETEKI